MHNQSQWPQQSQTILNKPLIPTMSDTLYDETNFFQINDLDFKAFVVGLTTKEYRDTSFYNFLQGILECIRNDIKKGNILIPQTNPNTSASQNWMSRKIELYRKLYQKMNKEQGNVPDGVLTYSSS